MSNTHASTDPTGKWNSHAWRDAVATATDLTWAQKTMLLFVENRYSDWTTGENVRPSCATIGQMLGMSRQTVQGHITSIRKAGWLTLTRPATNREPAHYRLSYGAFLSFDETPQTSGNPTSTDPTSGNPTSRGRETRRLDVGKPDTTSSETPPYTPSVFSSSSSNSPEPPEPKAEDDEDEDFSTFIAAYPKSKGRRGDARAQAREAYAVARLEYEPDEILDALRADHSNALAAWPDKWLTDHMGHAMPEAHVDASIRRGGLGRSRGAHDTDPWATVPFTKIDTQACPDCHGSGNAEDPETKMPIGRCAHPYAPLIKCYAA